MSAERMNFSSLSEPSEDAEVTIDPSMLDCPICYEPLQLPLFQCINGHVACSECGKKLGGKCPVCSTLHTSRCIPFESIIRSTKVKCPYTKSGCQNTLPYSQITAHKNLCLYGPCSCPVPACNFECKGIGMKSHISRQHTSFEQQIAFKYNQWLSVSVQKDQPYILQGPINVYVLLNRRVELGYVFWISHVCTVAEKGYELKVEGVDGNSLKLKGRIKNVRILKDGSPEFFMYVPQNLLTSTGHLNVKIKISNMVRISLLHG